MSAKTAEVTEALKFFINLGIAYGVDDEGFILDTHNPDHVREVIQVNNEPKYMVLYQEDLANKNGLVINPFSEGIGKLEQNEWFYRVVIAAAMRARLCDLYYKAFALTWAIKNKKPSTKKGEPGESLPLGVVDLLSSIEADVDEKMVQEIKKFFVDIRPKGYEIFNLGWLSRMMTCTFRTAFLEENNLQEEYGLRVKTWTALQNFTKKVFQVDSDEELRLKSKHTPDDGAAPRIGAMMKTLFWVYQQINEPLDHLSPDMTVHLANFKLHVDRLPDYTRNAKFFTTTATTPSLATRSGQGSDVPLPTLAHQQMGFMVPTVPQSDNSVPLPANYVPQPGMYMHQQPQAAGFGGFGGGGGFNQPAYNTGFGGGVPMPNINIPGQTMLGSLGTVIPQSYYPR